MLTLAAYDYLHAGVSGAVDGAGENEDEKEDTAPAPRAGRKGKAAASGAGGPPIKRSRPAVEPPPEVSPTAPSGVSSELSSCKLKFAEFCDSLLRRWEGGSAPDADVTAAAQASVVAFAEANCMTKAQLAK